MEPLKLSDELAAELQNVVSKHDERAMEAGVAVQYYAAIIGYVLAQQVYSTEQKKDFLNQLNAFSHHVLDDCNSPAQSPRDDTAMGKWRPSDS
ncbi:hypothetical protein [Kaarinaea lacus]